MPGVGGLIRETAPALLVFVAIFLAGEHIRLFRSLDRDGRGFVSFSAGMSIAYVFVHMMPELHGARTLLVEAAAPSLELRYEGMAIYFLALVGFLWFYGLDRLRAKSAEAGHGGRLANLHLSAMAGYAALMCYLLVRDAGDSVAATAMFTLAFGGHFLGLEHSLREEYGAAWRRSGRWVMVAACVLGWGVGVSVGVPSLALALLVAFISGGVIMTNTLMELSEGKDGRFGPFMAGSLLYGLLLVPLG